MGCTTSCDVPAPTAEQRRASLNRLRSIKYSPGVAQSRTARSLPTAARVPVCVPPTAANGADDPLPAAPKAISVGADSLDSSVFDAEESPTALPRGECTLWGDIDDHQTCTGVPMPEPRGECALLRRASRDASARAKGANSDLWQYGGEMHESCLAAMDRMSGRRLHAVQSWIDETCFAPGAIDASPQGPPVSSSAPSAVFYSLSGGASPSMSEVCDAPTNCTAPGTVA